MFYMLSIHNLLSTAAVSKGQNTSIVRTGPVLHHENYCLLVRYGRWYGGNYYSYKLCSYNNKLIINSVVRFPVFDF